MATTAIEWTQNVWNPVTGCSRVSEGCENCYAESFAKRLKGMGIPKYKQGFKVILHPDSLEEPYRWKKPRVVFVNSMSDIFHQDISDSYIKKIFHVMNENPHHIFQVLTKRPERLPEIESKVKWSHNIWLGVTVESNKHMDRICYLQDSPARTRFISFEPLLSPIEKMNLSTVDWAIVGGESGPKARPMEKAWVESILHQCKEQDVAFFFKQWGGKNKKKNGRLLNGREYNQMPIFLEA